MPRHKAAQNCKVPFWMSARQDCKEGRFVQVGNSLLLSEAFQKLSMGARNLYLCMAMESGGKRAFTFPQSAGKKYGFPPRSMRRYQQELLDAGFVELESSGKATREKNCYVFSPRWRSVPED